MKFDMYQKLFEGQSATCIITGDYERGYLKAYVDGAAADVGPDLTPDEDPKQRSFFATHFDPGTSLFTKPGWTHGQKVRIQCFDATGAKVGESDELVVL